MTPPAAVASSSSSSTLHSEHGGKLIDGPTALQTQAIVAQPLPGLQWDSAIDHPAVESTVTVSFNVSGAVGLGGFVRIVLPADGWSMPQQPNVQLMQVLQKTPQDNMQVSYRTRSSILWLLNTLVNLEKSGRKNMKSLMKNILVN